MVDARSFIDLWVAPQPREGAHAMRVLSVRNVSGRLELEVLAILPREAECLYLGTVYSTEAILAPTDGDGVVPSIRVVA